MEYLAAHTPHGPSIYTLCLPSLFTSAKNFQLSFFAFNKDLIIPILQSVSVRSITDMPLETKCNIGKAPLSSSLQLCIVFYGGG